MKRYIIILVLAFAAAACSRDPYESPGKSTANEGRTLSFSIKSENLGNDVSRATPSSLTRGVAADADYFETFIDFDGSTNKDVHIFFFNTSGNIIFYPEQERLSLLSDPGHTDTKTIKIDLEEVGMLPAIDPDLLLGKNTIVYVVANINNQYLRADFEGKTLQQVMDMTVSAGFNEVNGGDIVKQDKFVMDARETVYITGWNNVANLNLKRVASKIQMGIYNAAVSGYTASNAKVKLVNFVKTGAIGSIGTESYAPQTADFDATDYIAAPIQAGGTTETVQYAEPFYSYPSDWSGDISKEAYMVISMDWYPNGQPGDAVTYYYKLPISYIPADSEGGAAHRYRLKRNFIYRYFVNITSLGSLNPNTPKEISSSIDIADWSGTDIAVSIQKFDWLFVEQQTITIYPVVENGNLVQIQEYLVPYRSSTELSYPQAVIATYQKYDNTANSPTRYQMVTTNCTGDQIPTVDINYAIGEQKYIKITSKVPDNYAPKDIIIKVQNDALLYAYVYVTHYPPLYVTGKESTGMGVTAGNIAGSISAGSDKNLFTITTLALTGDEKFTWSESVSNGTSTRAYSVGDPKNTSGAYVDNADNAWVVSPKFVVQSSLGKARGDNYWFDYWGTVQYGDAKTRCRQYAEDAYDAGTWRLPTMAELYLITKLQRDGSAVQGILEESWGSQRVWTSGTYLLTGSRGGNTSYNSATDVTRGAVFNKADLIGTGAVNTPLVGYYHVPLCVRDMYQ